MKQRLSRFIAGAMVVASAISLLPAPAWAATAPASGFSVTVSPASQNLDTKPGVPVSSTILVKNNGIATEHLKATVMKFAALGPNGTPTLETPGPHDDFVHWVTMPQTTFSLDPGLWQSFKLSINPPKTAAFGYYYALVFSRDTATPKVKGGQALIGSVVSLILLNVQATGALRQASIASFRTDNKVVEFLPTVFRVQMHNDGNVHVAPRGNIFISKGNKDLATLEVNLSEGNILPNAYRLYTALWSDGTPLYHAKPSPKSVATGNQTTNLDWSNFTLSRLRYGKYHARLVMVYNNGENDAADQAALDFWVMPWRIIAAIVLVIVLVLAGVWALVLRPLRRRIGQGRGGYARRR